MRKHRSAALSLPGGFARLAPRALPEAGLPRRGVGALTRASAIIRCPSRAKRLLFLFLLAAGYWLLTTPALAQDADGDGMPDAYENTYGCLMANTADADVDYEPDGMTSGEEYNYSAMLDPCDPDTDDDTLPDGWETQNDYCGFDPRSSLSEMIWYSKAGPNQRVTSTFSNSAYPFLAWSGSEFGVIWQDNREGNTQLYFARVSASGSKIDPDIRITSDGSVGSLPSLSWTDSEFGVVWSDRRDGNDEIYFTRISAAGTKIGNDLRVTNAANYSTNPSLSWTGSEFGVSWIDGRDGQNQIYFTRMSEDGTKIGNDYQITFDITNHWQKSEALAWTGSEFGLSWHGSVSVGNYEIFFARVSADGAKIGGDIRVTMDTSVSYSPSLTWTGSEFGVSWEDYRDSNYEIYFARLSTSGNKVGTDLRVTSHSEDSTSASLAWNGSEFGASWMDYRDGSNDIYFTRVSSSGNKIGTDLRVTADSRGSALPILSWAGSRYGVIWFDSPDGNYQIFFSTIGGDYTDKDADGLAEDVEYSLGTNPCEQDTDGDGMDDDYEFFQSCLDPIVGDGLEDGDEDGLNNGDEHFFGTEPCNPDTDGDILPDGWETYYDACGFDQTSYQSEFPGRIGPQVLASSGEAPGYYPSLACSGSEFGVVWEDVRDGNFEIYFSRVSATGTKIGNDVRVSYDQEFSTEPSLVWTGTEFGVSWRHARLDYYAIKFARISAAGTKIGGDYNVSSSFQELGNPSLVWTGSVFGVSWDDMRDFNAEIYFARLSAAGFKIGPDVRITNYHDGDGFPSISWTGSEFGVIWQSHRSGYEMYFTRISAAGAKIGDDIRITVYSYNGSAPSLCWTGSEFGVSWDDDRDGNEEIHFVRLSADGTKIGGDIRVSADASESQRPSLVWSGSEFGVSWSDLRNDLDGICDYYSGTDDCNHEIYFVRLSADGTKLIDDLRITNSHYPNEDPSLCWTGSEFGLGYGFNSSTDLGIFIARISPDAGLYTDKDHDSLREDLEYALGTNPCIPDSDGDGLEDGEEVNAYATDPNDQDTDDDGVSDGDEVNVHNTLPNDWDSDGDYLPDGFEVLNLSGHSVGEDLDPLDAADGDTSFDGDGMPNAHEYWNGSDVWGDDPMPTPGYEVGCYYWGKSDGGIAVQPGDIAAMQKAYVGVSVDYSEVLPSQYDPMDLDRDMFPGPGDIVLAQGMYVGLPRPEGYVSSPIALTVEDAPVGPVAVGDTTHVTVSVHAAGPGAEEFSPGMGVVFWVESGNAVLLGGEGMAPGEAAGNRYDVSMRGSDGAPANMVVLITGPGPVAVNAKVPACGTEPVGRWAAEVSLAGAVVINP